MSSIQDQIKELHNASSILDPDAQTRQGLLDYVNQYTNEFLESQASRPAYIETPDKAAGLYDTPIREEGRELESVIDVFRENVEIPGLNAASGGHLAYIPACSMYLSALGDYIAAVVNRFPADFATSPGAVRMEHQVLRWIADLVGYPMEAAGNLASGGSVATLSAVVTARESHGLLARDYHRAVVYTTEHTHKSRF